VTPAPSAAGSARVLAGAEAPGGPQRRSSARGGAPTAGYGGSGRRSRGKRPAGAAIVAQPSSAQQSLDAARFVDQTETQISTRWMEGFYPIYAVAQGTFGVN